MPFIHFSRYFISWSQGHAVYSVLQKFHFVITKDQPLTTYLDSSLRGHKDMPFVHFSRYSFRDHKDMPFIHFSRYFIPWSQSTNRLPLILIVQYVFTRESHLSTHPHKDQPLWPTLSPMVHPVALSPYYIVLNTSQNIIQFVSREECAKLSSLTLCGGKRSAILTGSTKFTLAQTHPANRKCLRHK
jgi:hypothetical protein